MNDLINVKTLSQAGMVVLLSIVVVSGIAGYWVPGSYYTEMKADRDKWEQSALNALTTAKQVSSVRMPIMAQSPVNTSVKPTPENVKSQLDLLKKINNIPQ